MSDGIRVPGQLGTIDREAQRIRLAPPRAAGEAISSARELEHDVLTFAIGSCANDFGTPGVGALPLHPPPASCGRAQYTPVCARRAQLRQQSVRRHHDQVRAGSRYVSIAAPRLAGRAGLGSHRRCRVMDAQRLVVAPYTKVVTGQSSVQWRPCSGRNSLASKIGSASAQDSGRRRTVRHAHPGFSPASHNWIAASARSGDALRIVAARRLSLALCSSFGVIPAASAAVADRKVVASDDCVLSEASKLGLTFACSAHSAASGCDE